MTTVKSKALGYAEPATSSKPKATDAPESATASCTSSLCSTCKVYTLTISGVSVITTYSKEIITGTASSTLVVPTGSSDFDSTAIASSSLRMHHLQGFHQDN